MIERQAPGDRLQRIGRIELVCALVLVIAISVLHVHRASHAGPLWRDEICTLNAATWPSLTQAWDFMVFESFPLLIYAVVRAWAAMGWADIDMSLRVLGAIVGIAGLFALFSAKRLFGRQVPTLSLALFGLNATVISWGDSMRAYGLGVLLIFLAYGLIWKVAVSPTPLRVGLATLVAVLSVQALFQNSVLLFAICLGGIFVCLRHGNWRRAFSILGIGIVAALSLLPYVPRILQSQQMFVPFQFRFATSHFVEVFVTAMGSKTDTLLWAWVIGGVASIIAGGFIVVTRQRKEQGDEPRVDIAVFCLTISILGTVLFFMFLKAARLPTEPWYYIVPMGSIALSIDIVMELVARSATVRILRLMAVTVIATVAIPIAWSQASFRQTNIDIIATQLGQQTSRGDFVVVIPWYVGITFENYYRGEIKWSTVPPIGDLKFTRHDLLKEQMASEQPLRPVLGTIEQVLKSGGRVWVVGALAAPAGGQLPPSLPPAPNGPNGWYSGDYVGNWNLQVGYFLKQHSITIHAVPGAAGQRTNPYEDLPVLVFSGWRG